MELQTKGKLLSGELLSSHTSLHLGGEAKYFLFASDWEDISKSLSFAREKNIPSFIIGEGSNVLFLDEGFSGIVITTKNMRKIDIEDNKLIAQSGASLSEVINVAKESSLSGFESLIGIPGSVGGASVMNAGAFNCEIGDYIETARVFRDGRGVRIEDIGFSYRDSSLSEEIVLEIEFALNKKRKEYIEKEIREKIKLRKENQPSFSEGVGTCGSVFKNPEGYTAGELIEQAGLKGMKVGGVRVPEEHGNYFLTDPGSKARDFIEMVRLVRDKVKEKFGVILKMEVKVVGKEGQVQI